MATSASTLFQGLKNVAFEPSSFKAPGLFAISGEDMSSDESLGFNIQGKPAVKRTRSQGALQGGQRKDSTSIFDIMRQIDVQHRFEETHSRASAAAPRLKRRKTKAAPPALLLADKYAPKTYWELNITETSNRRVQRWLQRWLDRTIEEPAPENESALERHKILMMHGPPGSGKTTGLRVILQNAGFKLHEYDASDVLTSQFVERTLKPTLCYENVHNTVISTSALGQSPDTRHSDGLRVPTRQIKQYPGGGIVEVLIGPEGGRKVVRDTRPVAVVIDGADDLVGREGREFFKALFALYDASEVPSEDRKSARGRKASKPIKVLRPVIFVANKQRALHLRELRRRSYLVERPHAPSKLVREFLAKVCAAENIEYGHTQLDTLIEQHNGDIRACLNTLQSFGGNFALHASTMDTALDPVAFGARLFHAPASMRTTPEIEKYGGSDLDMLLNTVFTQYVNSNTLMQRPELVGDWVELADQARSRIFWNGAALENYQRSSVHAVTSLFRCTKKLPVQWPENDYETKLSTQAILKRALERASPALHSLYTSQRALMELYPYVSLMSETVSNNPKLLQAIGDSLQSTGVHISRVNDGLGRSHYALDPEIDTFVQLNAGTSSNEKLDHSLGAEAAPNDGPQVGSFSREAIYQLCRENYQHTNILRAQQTKTFGVVQNNRSAPLVGALKHQQQQRHKIALKDKDLIAPRKQAVWLDYKPADENAARRPIGWLDIFN